MKTITDPALIATFYVERGEPAGALLTALTGAEHAQRHKGAGLALTYYPDRDDWGNQEQGTYLRRWDPPNASQDTTILQLVLNAPEGAEAVAGFDSLWERLSLACSPLSSLRLENNREPAVEPEGAAPATPLEDKLWGCTLVYQAVLPPEADPDQAAAELLPHCRPVGGPPPRAALAAGDVAGGRLWLLQTPGREGAVSLPTTLYLALAPADGERALVREVLLGENAALLGPELVAHKGYHQAREFPLLPYRQWMKGLRKTTTDLLGAEGLTRPGGEKAELEALVGRYAEMNDVVAYLIQLHISLRRQRFNYDKATAGASLPAALVACHRERLERDTLELEYAIGDGQAVLDSARTAIEVLRAHFDAQQTAQGNLINLVLMVIATALALGEILPDALNPWLQLAIILAVGVGLWLALQGLLRLPGRQRNGRTAKR